MDDLVICRCEEVTRDEILEVVRGGAESVNTVKRLTRAGMGLCQGKICGRLLSQLLSRELKIPMSEMEPLSVRPPVRPIKFSALATKEDGSTGSHQE